MEYQSFNTSIEVTKPADEVFSAIKEIPKWWNSEDFEGSCAKLNDEFIIHHPGQHYSKQRVIEDNPFTRIVWLVTESELFWLKKNRQEWTNTKMIFDIATQNDKTNLHFTHHGLTPDKECYRLCEMGWTMIIKEFLFHLIIFGASSADLSKAAEIRNRSLEK